MNWFFLSSSSSSSFFYVHFFNYPLYFFPFALARGGFCLLAVGAGEGRGFYCSGRESSTACSRCGIVLHSFPRAMVSSSDSLMNKLSGVSLPSIPLH